METASDRRLCPRCSGALVPDGRAYRCVACAYRTDAKPDRAARRGRKPRRGR